MNPTDATAARAKEVVGMPQGECEKCGAFGPMNDRPSDRHFQHCQLFAHVPSLHERLAALVVEWNKRAAANIYEESAADCARELSALLAEEGRKA